ncbi:FHA domain-containing protein [Amycolatopsis sp. 195334CR]|uniref:FHA domain-containing protein n=1 Tax=Amycolatopsis sp. 195334CR TaxID=2814588 RepID=UPI001A8EF564|nr:FHA domain-containing protein [Amycolatopsis sp. 195334CR]MBN6039215.1 FHA domain-containing protein [Amycolatopsis sp. 195334CR]
MAGVLAAGHASLALGVPSEPGSLHALSAIGGVTIDAAEDRVVVFGRNRPEVDVCVGEHDVRVSRRQGVLSRRDGRWCVRNTGRVAVRLPRSRLLGPEEEPVALPGGYTPLFVRGANGREHLLELYVGGGPAGAAPRPSRLSATERLVLVACGCRYLLHEAGPRPMPKREAAVLLAELRPAEAWPVARVEFVLTTVRARLAAEGPLAENADDHGLLRELVTSATLVPPDLALLTA